MRKGEIACYNVFYFYISLVRQNEALCGNGFNPKTYKQKSIIFRLHRNIVVAHKKRVLAKCGYFHFLIPYKITPVTPINLTLYQTTNKKTLFSSILKAFADDNFIVVKMVQFLFDRVENLVDKGENAGSQHFLLFPTMSSKYYILSGVISRHCMVND